MYTFVHDIQLLVVVLLLHWTHVTVCVFLFSALSQEEQDDAQLKIEDILQMVSIIHTLLLHSSKQKGFCYRFHS